MTDDEKLEALILRIEALASDMGFQYAIPIDEKDDGTSEVMGVIIGSTDFIASIVSSLDIGPVVELPQGENKLPALKKSDDDDPTFH